MSTRAVIARQSKDGWEGVYQHSDGYPTGLGKELWHCLHSEYGGDLVGFLRDVIDAHPGGWSHFAKAVPRELWTDYQRFGMDLPVGRENLLLHHRGGAGPRHLGKRRGIFSDQRLIPCRRRQRPPDATRSRHQPYVVGK